MTAHFPNSSDVISGIVDYTPQRSVYRSLAKRAFDIVFVLTSSVLVVPVTLLLALVVMADGGTPFFIQERVGKDGRVFRMVKLRSMVAHRPAARSGCSISRSPRACSSQTMASRQRWARVSSFAQAWP